MTPSRHVVLALALVPLAFCTLAQTPPKGRGDPSFAQPSLADGVDYVVPTEAEIKATAYRIFDTQTGQPITDFTHPIKTAGVDNRAGQFNDWDYPVGVVLAALLNVSDSTGDPRYR